MRATLAGSAGSRCMSCARGLSFGTAQKPQPRVHRLPRIMKVAAPRWKHSWMLGQRADSQTVWRFRRRRPLFSRLSDSKWVRPLRAHSGRRARAASPRRPICTSESLTLFLARDGIRRFPVASWRGPSFAVSLYGPTSTRIRLSGPGSGAPGTPCLSASHQDFGIGLVRRHHLPVGAGRELGNRPPRRRCGRRFALRRRRRLRRRARQLRRLAPAVARRSAALASPAVARRAPRAPAAEAPAPGGRLGGASVVGALPRRRPFAASPNAANSVPLHTPWRTPPRSSSTTMKKPLSNWRLPTTSSNSPVSLFLMIYGCLPAPGPPAWPCGPGRAPKM